MINQTYSPILEVKNLTKVFRIGGLFSGTKIYAVNDVSFSLPGDKPFILSIVGESGCGKTTLSKMILRLVSPTSGEIFLNGVSCNDKNKIDNTKYRSMVQPIFQNPFESFSSRRTVEKYLLDTARNFGGANNIKEAVEMADKSLKDVGLDYKRVYGKYISQFSGGELQRVAIARALITHPKVIMADEPVASIDASMKMNIINLFKSLKEKHGISFVYITHDLSTAYYVSDQIAILYRGDLVECGDSKSIMENPAHPYTKLLMEAIPHIGSKWMDEDTVLLSNVEAVDYNLKGCKFAPRCPYVSAECRSLLPLAQNAQNGRMIRCRNPLINSDELSHAD